MKNAKKFSLALWRQRLKSPEFLKNFFVFIMFFIILFLAIILIWKRHTEKKVVKHEIALAAIAPEQSEKKEQKEEKEEKIEKKLEEKTITIQNEVSVFADRITALEQKTVQQQQGIEIPHKLITLELLKGVLEGFVPLAKLIAFLLKNPEPWAKILVTPLVPLKECKTYPQLEAMLILPASPEILTLWERFLKTVISLVQVRKLDEKGGYILSHLKDVQVALREHDIQKALQVFEKLPPSEKARLVSWKQAAQNRQAVETITKNFYLELMGG
ncbi:MAG: hypothetical protein K2P93_02480 [Alphaproteobacteria bacterium]|nr:hypothetical protein [Alphaproteobacteria bacterium]